MNQLILNDGGNKLLSRLWSSCFKLTTVQLQVVNRFRRFGMQLFTKDGYLSGQKVHKIRYLVMKTLRQQSF
jgi:hypothetical protein